MANAIAPISKSGVSTGDTKSEPDPIAEKQELEKRRDRPPWIVFAAFLLTSVAVLSLLAWSLSSARILFLELLVAAGATSVGGLLGFLFGMPRGPIESPNTDDGNDKVALSITYRPSNNLEQVSDWLTKILIGVGLVELTKLQGALSGLGRSVEMSLAGAPAGTSVVTQIVVLTFLVLGFLASFLWTRIYYGPLQTLADNDVVSSLRAKLTYSQTQLKQEKETRKKAVSVADSMAKGEIAIPAVPPLKQETPARARATSDLQVWPSDVREKIEEFKKLPANWNTDPGAQLFPQARKEANGRRLEAEIDLELSDTLIIKLRVRSVSGETLRGPVAFLLHPTFTERIIYAEPTGDVAEVTISSGGWFTAVAILDAGKTILSYDLRELPNVPAWFKKK